MKDRRRPKADSRGHRSFPALPTGRYVVTIVDSDWRDAVNISMCFLRLRVCKGELKGHEFLHTWAFEYGNSDRALSDESEFMALCDAARRPYELDVANLHGIPVEIEVERLCGSRGPASLLVRGFYPHFPTVWTRDAATKESA